MQFILREHQMGCPSEMDDRVQPHGILHKLLAPETIEWTLFLASVPRLLAYAFVCLQTAT